MSSNKQVIGNMIEKVHSGVEVKDQIIKELFMFCINTYKTSILIIGDDGDDGDGEDEDEDGDGDGDWDWGQELHEEIGRLLLWGHTYTVSEGGLDMIFENTKDTDLKESTVILLCSIARVVDAYFLNINLQVPQAPPEPKINSSNEPAPRLGSAGLPKSETLKPLVQKCDGGAKTNTESNLGDLLYSVQGLMPNIASLAKQNSSNGNGDPLGLNLTKTVKDLKSLLDTLFGLIPSIDQLCSTALQERPAAVEEVRPGAPNCARASIQSHKNGIRSNFPKIEDHLVDTLAEINWSRLQQIRGFARNHTRVQENEDKGLQETCNPSPLQKCALDSSGTTDPILGSHPTLLPKVSKLLVGDGYETNSIHSSNSCVPKPPVFLFPGITFECSLCFELLKGVDTEILWREHVLRDLKPYSCLFSYCPEKYTLFTSREAWIAHEFEHHRPQDSFEWHCIDSCTNVYGNRDDFVQHILVDHLEGAAVSHISGIVENRKIKIGSTNPNNNQIPCPFCGGYISETEISVKLHVGTHMDELALNALASTYDYYESENETPHTPQPARYTPSRPQPPLPMAKKTALSPDPQTIKQAPLKNLPHHKIAVDEPRSLAEAEIWDFGIDDLWGDFAGLDALMSTQPPSLGYLDQLNAPMSTQPPSPSDLDLIDLNAPIHHLPALATEPEPDLLRTPPDSGRREDFGDSFDRRPQITKGLTPVRGKYTPRGRQAPGLADNITGRKTLKHSCPHPGCVRAGDNGFSRKHNLMEHSRIVHGEPIRFVRGRVTADKVDRPSPASPKPMEETPTPLTPPMPRASRSLTNTLAVASRVDSSASILSPNNTNTDIPEPADPPPIPLDESRTL